MSGDAWVSGDCDVCGSYMLRQSCWMCLGRGGWDMYEFSPIEYEPGDIETCDVCDGDGTLTWCPNEREHQTA